MGQAKRRGTFEERKAEAIERHRSQLSTAIKETEEREAAMTPEERTRRYTAQSKLARFAAMPWMESFNSQP